MSDSSSTYDVLLVGGGAAGLSAALVLSRARRTVDAGEPRYAPAAHLHGFLSRDGMPPHELLAAGREEVRRYDGTLLHGRVSNVSRTRPRVPRQHQHATARGQAPSQRRTVLGEAQ